MACESQRCSARKKTLGPAVWRVDGKQLCATCYEDWMELPTTEFDRHKIVRMEAGDDAFVLRKGNINGKTAVAAA